MPEDNAQAAVENAPRDPNQPIIDKELVKDLAKPPEPLKLVKPKFKWEAFKWFHIFYTMCVVSIAIYICVAISERPLNIQVLLFIPVILTAISNLFAIAAFFGRFSVKIACGISLVVFLLTVVSVIFILIRPDVWKGGIIDVVLFFTLEPPFFIPLFILNLTTTGMLFLETKKPPKELLF